MARIITGALPAAPNGHLTDLRAGHGPRAILAMHSADCIGCRDYVRGIANDPDLSAWGGHLTIIVRDSLDTATKLYEQLHRCAQVLADPGHSVAIADGSLAVTDEWGEVYFETTVDTEHQLPPPPEVVNWVRFIAIQCPECVGVEGDWRFLSEGDG